MLGNLKKYWWLVFVPFAIVGAVRLFTDYEQKKLNEHLKLELQKNGFEQFECKSIQPIATKKIEAAAVSVPERISGLSKNTKRSVLKRKPQIIKKDTGFYGPRIGPGGRVMHYNLKTNSWI